MKGFIKWMDDAPFIVKIILAFPGLDFIWGIYRIAKGIKNDNAALLIIGVFWTFLGIPLLWIVDMITIVFQGRPTVLVD